MEKARRSRRLMLEWSSPALMVRQQEMDESGTG